MIKIALKEPVGGGLFGDDRVPARSAEYMEAKGAVTKILRESWSKEIEANGVMSFIDPGDNPFLVAARNIAYILESPK